MLVGALARNAQDPSKAGALSNALSRDHDGSVLDDVAGYLGRGDDADGDGILGHVLGGKQQIGRRPGSARWPGSIRPRPACCCRCWRRW